MYIMTIYGSEDNGESQICPIRIVIILVSTESGWLIPDASADASKFLVYGVSWDENGMQGP